ncbi:hypothetical protein RZS08_53980, partial [Arthrospira platensis SPKY1]|nr:hypothetical protein [Arthrospira platensis SPKY1]
MEQRASFRDDVLDPQAKVDGLRLESVRKPHPDGPVGTDESGNPVFRRPPTSAVIASVAVQAARATGAF